MRSLIPETRREPRRVLTYVLIESALHFKIAGRKGCGRDSVSRIPNQTPLCGKMLILWWC